MIMGFEVYRLNPWTFMLGFAWHDYECEGERRLEVFLGLFALSFIWKK